MSVKTISTIFMGGDYITGDTADGFIKAFAWPMIIQSAGWAILAGSKLELTKAGRDALNRPAHEMLHHAWNCWMKTDIMDEYNRLDIIKCRLPKTRGGLSFLVKRRSAIQEVLT